MIIALVAGCGRERSGRGSSNGSQAGDERTEGEEWFVDRTQETGLDFVHFNGMSGEFYIPENMGPGIGLVDYDNDGDLDVYLVQGQMLGPRKTLSQTRILPEGPLPLRGRLYRNDLTTQKEGTRLHFTDVTEESGIDARGYGMGVAAGDYNNDGCVDLYLTNFGRNQLFRNNCDGTFTDVSRASRTDDAGWSVSAAFVDYDRDGWLDLYVAHYLDFSLETHKNCLGRSGERDYCHPSAYQPQASRLHHNNRDGTFTEATAKALVGAEPGPALGVSTADFNGDQWIDIFVANDSQENQLWINQRDGTLRNTALIAGVALTQEGNAEASMGVDAGDFDNDGDEDLFVTELTSEGHNLYVNDGSGIFEERSLRSGLGPASLPYTGFGTAWFDFDNDGWLDILTANGTITGIEALVRAHDPFPQRQPKQLFRNLGDARFEDVTGRAGAVFRSSDVGRGAAFGDIDNDGDVDVIVGNDAGRTQLLVNNIGSRKHWVGLRGNIVGARVAVFRANAPTLWRRARTDGSYASANDPRVLIGLGDSAEPPRVQVRWPSGRVEQWPKVDIDRYTTLKEGTGQ